MQNQSSGRPFQLASLKVAAWLMSLTLSFSAAAACNEKSAEKPRDGRPEASQPRDGGAKDFGGRNFEGLHQQLKLSNAQEALWQTAFDNSEKLRQDMMNSFRDKQGKPRDAQESKTPDLRALATEMDKEMDAWQQKRKTVREAWLKFYDTLGNEQKQIASRFVLGQIGLMGEPHAGPHGHGPDGMGPDRGGDRGERGDRGMPPPPPQS